ncbi:MAG: tyrosine-type recombinase/integrase [Gammaproteobacteria bacterium]|nr:tyrosine-type recombinase/integrase [Gammaproteobacteria bacterium]
MKISNNSTNRKSIFSIEELRDAARSDNTRIAYDKGWDSFVSWCESVGLVPREAQTEDVVRYFIAVGGNDPKNSNKKLSINTLRLFRSGLNYRWRQMGINSPAAEKVIDDILLGLAKTRNEKPRRVKALREFQIISMLSACNQNLYGMRDAAIISLGFSAALRRSEICELQIEDLERKSSDKMILHIRRSKTDPQGSGQSIALLEGKSIMPIKHLEYWIHATGINSGYLFQTLKRGGAVSGQPLDPGEIARIVKRYAKKVGLDPQNYSGHSLRAGFVTSAAAHHARLDKIMEVTRHKNAETLMKYIRDEESFNDHAGSSFL